MLETTDESLTQGTQQEASLQQPRNDLQQSGSTSNAGGATTFQPAPSITQDSLGAAELRVGTSTIQNTTSIPPQAQATAPDYINAAWFWLLVPLALTIYLFWPQKKSSAEHTQVPDRASNAVKQSLLLKPKKQRRHKRYKSKR